MAKTSRPRPAPPKPVINEKKWIMPVAYKPKAGRIWVKTKVANYWYKENCTFEVMDNCEKFYRLVNNEGLKEGEYYLILKSDCYIIENESNIQTS